MTKKKSFDPCGRDASHMPASLLALAMLAAAAAAQQDPDPAHAVSTMASGADREEALPAAPAAAGRAASPGASDPLVAIHTAAPDHGVEYGIWGAGPDYKVSFHDGATFVPMLGKDYPHNQPLRWTTTSVTVGGTELCTREPQLSYGGLRASYDLGSVVEAYELQQGGVEQTFVLPRRVGAGELVVRGAITSLLTAAPTAPAHQELRFVDGAGRHLVTYGAAVAIDASGRRQPMTTGYEDGHITLRLDGAWLDAAAYPVVVDPLLGPGSQPAGAERSDVDILRDAGGATDSVWLAFSTWASASDRDVYMRRFDDDGTAAALVFADATSNWSSQDVSVGYVFAADRVILAFDRILATGIRQIRYHVRLRNDFTQSSAYETIPTSGNAWRPDVGGSHAPGGVVDALVVWQEENNNGGPFQPTSSSSIRGTVVDVAAQAAGPVFPIATGALIEYERPRVNQMSFGGAQNTWLVAYQTFTTFTIGGVDDWDVAIREVDLNGNVSAPHFVDVGSSDHKFAPWIEGASGRYLVAFTASPNTGSPVPSGVAGHEIRTVRVDWTQGAGSGSQPHGTKVLQSNNDARLELGGLGYDRATDSHWALQFRSNVTDSLYLRTVGYTGSQLQAETVLASPAGTSVPGGVAFDASGPQFVIGYALNTAGTNYVTMDRWVYPAVVPDSASGPSCSPASIAWIGSQQIGSELSKVRVSGAAVDAIHVCLAGSATTGFQLIGFPPIQNGCWILVPNAGPDHLGILDVRVGSIAEWNLPLPEFLGPMTLYFQGVHTVGGGVFEFVTTQRLEASLVR